MVGAVVGAGALYAIASGKAGFDLSAGFASSGYGEHSLIHPIGIPVTNLPVNPARSAGPAVFAGGWAVRQLRLFWVAPIPGALLAGIAYGALFGEGEAAKPDTK